MSHRSQSFGVGIFANLASIDRNAALRAGRRRLFTNICVPRCRNKLIGLGLSASGAGVSTLANERASRRSHDSFIAVTQCADGLLIAIAASSAGVDGFAALRAGWRRGNCLVRMF